MLSKIEKPQLFKNNSLLKKGGVSHHYTLEQIEEIEKCINDPVYLFQNYIYIINLDKGRMLFSPYEYQKKVIEDCRKYRYNVILQARQTGKCVSPDTMIRVRNKNTGEIRDVTIKEFHELHCSI